MGWRKIEQCKKNSLPPSMNCLSNRNIFRVCIAWCKHERGGENSRQLCQPETKSKGRNPWRIPERVCRGGYSTLWRVFINLCARVLKYPSNLVTMGISLTPPRTWSRKLECWKTQTWLFRCKLEFQSTPTWIYKNANLNSTKRKQSRLEVNKTHFR